MFKKIFENIFLLFRVLKKTWWTLDMFDVLKAKYKKYWTSRFKEENTEHNVKEWKYISNNILNILNGRSLKKSCIHILRRLVHSCVSIPILASQKLQIALDICVYVIPTLTCLRSHILFGLKEWLINTSSYPIVFATWNMIVLFRFLFRGWENIKCKKTWSVGEKN